MAPGTHLKRSNKMCAMQYHLMSSMLPRLKKTVDRAGEKNGRALLTQKKADDIRKIYASGMWSYSTLAPLFDVAPQTVAAIVQGRTWNK